MPGQVPSAIARAADGSNVTAAALRGNEEYYPKSIQYISDSETLSYLVLLTTSTGYAFSPNDVQEPGDFDIDGSDYRLNVMAVSDERIQLISGSGDGESEREVIEYGDIESIHGSDDGDRYTVLIMTEETKYTVNTAKKARLEDFRKAMGYVAKRMDE